jgi:hypothetical protein
VKPNVQAGSSLFMRPFICGICGDEVGGSAQWTLAAGWIHPACEPGLPEVAPTWHCPVCNRWTSVPSEYHVGSPAHLEALDDFPELVPEPISGQLAFFGGMR